MVTKNTSRPARQYLAEFPTEVVSVLNSGIHALSAGWGVHMRGVSGQKNTVHGIAIDHPHIGAIEGQPCGVVQPDIRPAGSFIYDLLKTFQGWIVRIVRRNLGLKLELIRAWQWADCDPHILILMPGRPVFPIKTIDSNI